MRNPTHGLCLVLLLACCSCTLSEQQALKSIDVDDIATSNHRVLQLPDLPAQPRFAEAFGDTDEERFMDTSMRLNIRMPEVPKLNSPHIVKTTLVEPHLSLSLKDSENVNDLGVPPTFKGDEEEEQEQRQRHRQRKRHRYFQHEEEEDKDKDEDEDEDEDVPKIPPNDPCIPHCERKGGWKTSACQGCVFKGLLNGFLYHHQAKGGDKDFNLFARQACHATRSSHSNFAECFFHQIHSVCNVMKHN